MRTFILFLFFVITIVPSVNSQNLSSDSRTAINTISTLLPRLFVKSQYTQSIGIEEFAKVRQEWEVYLVDYNAAVGAWNKIPTAEQKHPDVLPVRKQLAERITFFQQWTAQVKTTQKMIADDPSIVSNPASAVISETGKQKMAEALILINGVEVKNEYSGVLVPNQYVAAAEYYLKTRIDFRKAAGLLNSLSKLERQHPSALTVEEKVLKAQPVILNLEKQLKAVGSSQLKSGLHGMWAGDTEKYKESVLRFADVLGFDLPQNTSNGATLFELSPDNYDKVLKDLELLSTLMTGTYKDLVDNFNDAFPTLEKSPTVYRMVSVNRKALLPEVVKLSAKRFMDNAMHGAPRIEDLESQEGWMDGSFTPTESKKRLAEVKSRFTPVLKKSGISETEAGLNQLDTVYNAYWRKAEELAPKWTFPSESDASGDARAKGLFTNSIKSAYPGVQIIKLGFAYDAKWTIYLDSKNQPKHRTIGTTALIKIPGEKFYTAWQLLFNEDYVGGGKFSGGSIQWLKWRWQGNK